MIVSEQTVQNVLFIKHIGHCDYYYFISTEEMENKKGMTDKITSALSIKKENTRIILVPDDTLPEIDAILQRDFDMQDDDSIMVNMTGGTKIMSLGVYNYFARLGSASIYYIPIGKNKISKIFPFRRNGTSDITARLSLKEYLTSYGVRIINDGGSDFAKTSKNQSITRNIFKSFLDEGKRSEIQRISEVVRIKYRGSKIRKNTQNTEESSVFEETRKLHAYGMEFSEEDFITKTETKYITGDWFEEYIYNFITEISHLHKDNIRQGIQLEKASNSNEYDVMFVKENSLYVIECKTDISDYTDDQQGKISELFTSTLYKAATLKKEFGLVVKYYLFALNDFSVLRDHQKNRAENLGINLVGLDIIGNDDILREYISKM